LAKCYAPIDFSGMKSFPHDHIIDMEGVFPLFYGYGDSVVEYISTFIAFYKNNDFFHEDVMMKVFMINLRGSTQMRYEILGKGMFSSFAEFLEAFCASWDNDSTGWLPLVREIK